MSINAAGAENTLYIAGKKKAAQALRLPREKMSD